MTTQPTRRGYLLPVYSGLILDLLGIPQEEGGRKVVCIRPSVSDPTGVEFYIEDPQAPETAIGWNLPMARMTIREWKPSPTEASGTRRVTVELQLLDKVLSERTYEFREVVDGT